MRNEFLTDSRFLNPGICSILSFLLSFVEEQDLITNKIEDFALQNHPKFLIPHSALRIFVFVKYKKSPYLQKHRDKDKTNLCGTTLIAGTSRPLTRITGLVF